MSVETSTGVVLGMREIAQETGMSTFNGLRNGGILVVGDQSVGVDASRTPTKTATPTP